MKATIKIVTAEKDFSEEEKKLMKRIVCVFIEHGLSACVYLKKKTTKIKTLRIKAG
jgi:hypothetical protein